jgi:hypothetical protein
MKAIEFVTKIKHRAIQIPNKFKYPENVKAKVIILIPDPDDQGNYNKQNLMIAFTDAAKKGVFQNISDSVAWQKQMRDDWE